VADLEVLLASLREPWPPDEGALLSSLRRTNGWEAACDLLRRLLEREGADARTRAEELATRFGGRRPLMVYRAVLTSGLRAGSPFIEAACEAFQETRAAHALSALARGEVDNPYRVRADKVAAACDIAAALTAFGEEHEVTDDDAIVAAWARDAVVSELEPARDPWIGALPVVDRTILAYLRRASGEDGVRPDRRLWDGLRALGFALPGGWLTEDARQDAVVVATGAAAEVGVERSVLDEVLPLVA
jgi:hypothetical protein